MNYHHLYLFWRVAKEGQFTKAAASLRIAQSAVTAQIKQLEEVLNRTLIDRSNRRKPTLTEDGVAVVAFADSIFEVGSELLNWAKLGTSAGQKILRVGALSGLSRNLQYEFLKPLISRKAWKVEVISGDQEKLVRLLKEHALDLILSSHTVPADGRIRFHAHVLLASSLVFVIARAAYQKEASLNNYLRSVRLYLPGQNFEARAELDAFLERAKATAAIAGEIDDIALLRLFALHSEALVAVPEVGVRNELESGEVVLVQRAGKIEQRFYAITREKRVPSAVIAELIQSMRRQ